MPPDASDLSRRTFLAATVAGVAAAAQDAPPPAPDLRALVSTADLVYEKPVPRSEEGMPIGNGRMGTLVWTTPNRLRMQINRPDVYANNSASQQLLRAAQRLLRRLRLCGPRVRRRAVSRSRIPPAPLGVRRAVDGRRSPPGRVALPRRDRGASARLRKTERAAEDAALRIEVFRRPARDLRARARRHGAEPQPHGGIAAADPRRSGSP